MMETQNSKRSGKNDFHNQKFLKFLFSKVLSNKTETEIQCTHFPQIKYGFMIFKPFSTMSADVRGLATDFLTSIFDAK